MEGTGKQEMDALVDEILKSYEAHPETCSINTRNRISKDIIIDILEDIAGETRKTVAQVALNWLLQRPTICSLVIGARTEEHLKLNLGAIGWSLTAEQIKRLDEASKTPKIYPYWHQNQFPELKSQLIF